MRARIRIADCYEMEFAGAPAVWNEHLRPIFGGAEADTESDRGDASSDEGGAARSSSGPPSSGPPSSGPPSSGPPSSGPPSSGRRSEEPPRAAPAAKREARGEPPTIDDILDGLAELGGRRAEKDAVLAAVWARGGVRRDVTFHDVALVLRGHEAFRDVRVKPHLLKHITRTRMLAPGDERETVHLTDKGRRYVEDLIS